MMPVRTPGKSWLPTLLDLFKAIAPLNDKPSFDPTVPAVALNRAMRRANARLMRSVMAEAMGTTRRTMARAGKPLPVTPGAKAMAAYGKRYSTWGA